ncbi:MAG TPA: PKD domain-containing protein, partial [Chitinophagales bacterium]|nr:PKD domain-containing protein [Chitinophagales bacterium]
YLWTFGDGTSSSVFDTGHVYNLPGTYTITLIATDTNRCHPSDTVSQQVTMLPNGVVGFTSPDVCRGSVLQFANQSNPSAYYSWNFGDNSLSSLYSPTHVYTQAGNFTVQLIVIDSSTCELRDTVTHQVTVYQQPVAGFLVNADTFRFDHPVTFTENSIYYDHLLWNFGDGDTALDEADPVHSYETLGTMNVCIVASNVECADTFCRNLYISFSALIGVPNAFTPNGDGVNDVVKVEGSGIVAITFRIFNRWGEKVFETHDKNVGWDGTYKGVLQEVEVYTYTVEATMVNGQVIPLKGNITLLK